MISTFFLIFFRGNTIRVSNSCVVPDLDQTVCKGYQQTTLVGKELTAFLGGWECGGFTLCGTASLCTTFLFGKKFKQSMTAKKINAV